MGIKREIERRFLVDIGTAHAMAAGLPVAAYSQCYLPHTGIWQMRARRVTAAGATSYTTTLKRGVSHGVCDEIEDHTTENVWRQYLHAAGYSLDKTRGRMMLDDGLVLEIDIYEDEDLLPGHAVAEVELPRIDHPVALPRWLGREITGDDFYSNHALFALLGEMR